MSIIISKNGLNAKKIDKISFGLEDNLQQYIYDNPDSIPLYDIKDDVKLLILARELGTNSGPIDAFAVDKDGEIYLIETKLYKNPDKRTVVAQVLDYGASLWKHFTDFDELLLKLNTHVQKKFEVSINDKLSQYFQLTDEDLEILLNKMRENLSHGNFKFVVLMDSIEDRLKDLIMYVNQNSAFDIYGVELEYYKHDSFEIIIPKIYGAQVKKEVKTKNTNKAVLRDEEFLNAYQQIGCEKQIAEFLNLVKQIKNYDLNLDNLSADRTDRSITIKVAKENVVILKIGLHIDPIYQKTMNFACSLNDSQLINTLLSKYFPNIEIKSFTTNTGVTGRLQFADFNSKQLLHLVKNLSS